jgi:hypothetical protein
LRESRTCKLGGVLTILGLITIAGIATLFTGQASSCQSLPAV